MTRPSLSSIRAHEIALANGQTVVAQDGVGRRHMKEKLRQTIVGQVDLPGEFFLFRRARAQDDLSVLFAFKLRCVHAVQKGQGLRQECIQIGKVFLLACQGGHLYPRQPRRDAA